MLELGARLKPGSAVVCSAEGNVTEVQDGGHQPTHGLDLFVREVDDLQRSQYRPEGLIVVYGSDMATGALCICKRISKVSI